MPAVLAPVVGCLALLVLVDVVVLIVLAHHIAVALVVLWVLLGAAVGARMTARYGRRAWRGVLADARAGQLPKASTVDDLILMCAGVLVMLPGVVSDVLALLLLIPAGRKLVRTLATAVLFKRFGLLGLLMPLLAGRNRNVVVTSIVDPAASGSATSQPSSQLPRPAQIIDSQVAPTPLPDRERHPGQ